METAKNWKQQIGHQRDWVWRGWQIRYTYMPSSPENEKTNPPIILLHGFGASVEHWRKNIPVLSQQHRVYALDLLGFGASRKAYTQYGVHLWTQQIYDFWRTFINQPAILVGNSIGSLVSLAVVDTYPEMVKGMALLSLPDISRRQETVSKWLLPILTTTERLMSSPIFLKPLFKILCRPNILRNWVSIAYEDKTAITDELIEILLAPTQDEDAVKAFCALCQSVSHSPFSRSAKMILPQLNIPILLCWGLRDRMVPPQLAPGFAALNSMIEYIELDSVGHCPHDECPDQFNSLLLKWSATHFLPNHCGDYALISEMLPLHKK